MASLREDDPGLAALIDRETDRIESTLNLIAAENHPPPSVMEALGSVLVTKTIEGYPGRRFHAGCVHADAVERLAISRAKSLFGAGYANVQPNSGTAANAAVYAALLKPGDRVLAMRLAHGGHLSHGHSASVTSRWYAFDHYGVDPATEQIDYDALDRQAAVFGPQLIVAGASAYPRRIDYARIAATARSVGARLMADMAHIAGLVAAGILPSPVPHCDVVTLTCYKTLRGGRGGVILARENLGRDIDRAVFPGSQGTSPVNAIAAKALAFRLAAQPAFIRLQEKTLQNAVHLARGLGALGHRIVTGGTENHQVIVDVGAAGTSGGEAETALEQAGMVANRNTIPADAGHPEAVSGLRLGTGAVTARGMGRPEMDRIAGWIDRALRSRSSTESLTAIADEVKALCGQFPVYRSAT